MVLAIWVVVPPFGRARSQEPMEAQAFLQLDGNRLFPVATSKDYTADQRVERANRLLQEAVATGSPARIGVKKLHNLPVITLDDAVVLTVTRRDTPEGLTVQGQAELWRQHLTTALNRGRLERQPGYTARMVPISLAILGATFLLQRLLWLLWRRYLPSALTQPLVSEPGSRPLRAMDWLLHGVLVILRLGLWVAAILVIAGFFPVTRLLISRLLEALTESVGSPFLPLGGRRYSVLDAFVLVALFLVLVRGVAFLKGLLQIRVLQRTGIEPGSQEAIAFILQYGLLFLGTLVLLQLWGLDLTSLALFASVLGVGVGLGLQGIAKNLISGLIIMFERPIKVNDFVEVGDLQGTVTRVNLRSTEVVTLDRISIIVPNVEFLESRVVNWSHGSSVARLRIPVGVAHGSDPQVVRQALLLACQDLPDILETPPAQVFFKGFGDSSLDFLLLVWINQPRRQYEIRSELNFRIEAILRQYDLTMPFPQRDLHLRNERLEVAFPAEIRDALLHRLAPSPPDGAD
ncbi:MULTISPECIES: mechanosensitive ion channel family protein [unclassified Cyanobium]|uniref:mechanosensitive ion channel family protein n=1 Tax=unclassified Cyanobium TaxID=2627006 RepID=UPI0020CDE693|nr:MULTISPECIES: mechanosensitive ion channel domain-containing protein [unclassified Cyanobium]MCP9833729.1 mechanosensitive ion channel [Cyanobium sp. La Preciosa 7G6]MCP9936513.1 mechanosensitive ion channel [Cyanobium sp. Aljojuca 7A6]